jgi:hypothetical protein
VFIKLLVDEPLQTSDLPVGDSVLVDEVEEPAG